MIFPCMELFLVIFQVFHDFQSLWESCQKQSDLGLLCSSRPFWQAKVTRVRNFRTFTVTHLYQEKEPMPVGRIFLTLLSSYHCQNPAGSELKYKIHKNAYEKNTHRNK